MTLRRAADGLVEVIVSDTGLGMTTTQMQALFQPYNRLGREAGPIEGTGIGLVISRRLAELMGGALLVRSKAGVGSEFTLRMPAAIDEVPPPPLALETGPAPYRQRSVLYIEDNETNVEVMRGVLLQRPQVELSVVHNGLDGVGAVRRLRPDLVLLDMGLPDISGLELLRHLKHDDDIAGIPVIVVSADATAARIEEALTLGALHYVTKPLEVARFLTVLDEALERVETRWGM
jgi:CheY-like chemotaxis protein